MSWKPSQKAPESISVVSLTTTADSSGRTDTKDGPLGVAKRGSSVTLPGVISAQPG